jgi:hypothetical protein
MYNERDNKLTNAQANIPTNTQIQKQTNKQPRSKQTNTPRVQQTRQTVQQCTTDATKHSLFPVKVASSCDCGCPVTAAATSPDVKQTNK